MPKRKNKKEDTELIAVITAAVAATLEEGAPVPVITAVYEAEVPEAAREEETIPPADSFTARTIKRRDKRKNGRSPMI